MSGWCTLLLTWAVCVAANPVMASGSAGNLHTRLSETWGHAATQRHSWSLSSGTTWTPSSTHVEHGFRLRLVTGLASYRYTSRLFDSLTPDGRDLQFRGLRQTLELHAGYQWRLGPWTLKSFIGLDAHHEEVTLRDPEIGKGKARAWGVGLKATDELWWHISDRAWASLDVSFTTLYRAYGARARLGFKPHTAWSVGPELSASGTLADVWPSHTQRLGAFVRYDNGTYELSAAAGYDWTSYQKAAPYAAVQYLYRY